MVKPSELGQAYGASVNAATVVPKPQAVHIPEHRSPPECAFETIRYQVQGFEKELEHIEGSFSVSLTSGGYAMAVESIRLDGQLIIFAGRDESGIPLRVVQHYTQVSILLSKASPVGEKRPIGFYTD